MLVAIIAADQLSYHPIITLVRTFRGEPRVSVYDYVRSYFSSNFHV